MAECPLPIDDYPHIMLAHGGGGKLTHRLIEQLFLPAFRNELLDARHDGAVFNLSGARLAMTTDSYVVKPLVFPGGDIGSLAVNGTVNDLAMCGARPIFLSASFILEEGLPIGLLRRVVESMRVAADLAGVRIVTGDTKVVDKGKGDGIFINTAGIGLIEHDLVIAPAEIRPGDRILLSGDLGRHGMAILLAREELSLESVIESDCAPLAGVVGRLIGAGIAIHCLRDLTRGGLASALVELAEVSASQFIVDEAAIPLRKDLRGACEILGLDPLYLANEGRFIAILAPEDAGRALDILHAETAGADARLIGEVTATTPPRVLLRSTLGATRIVDMFSGEQLPRIC